MKQYKSWLRLLITVFTLQIAYCQEPTRRELDSLEQVLFSIDKSNTGEIVRLGEYLAEHTQSDEKKCIYLGVIVASYAVKNDKNKSINYLFRAKDAAERTGKPELIIRVYTTIASLYGALNLHEKAKLYLSKSAEMVASMPSGSGKLEISAFMSSEWGNFYLGSKDYKLANRYYKKSLDELSLSGNGKSLESYYYRTALHNYGKSFLKLKEPDSAKIFLERALTVRDTVYPALSYTIKADLAQVYADKADHKRAVDTLLKIAKNGNPKLAELKSDVYLKLAQSYRAMGDLNNYSIYNEKHLTLTAEAKRNDLDAINSVIDAEQESISTADRKLPVWLLYVAAAILGTFVVLYFLFAKKLWLSLRKVEEPGISDSPFTNPVIKAETPITIPPLVEKDILEKLLKFEQSESFTDAGLTISQLAVGLNTNTTYLSEIINRNKGKNFNSYINELRIAYICTKIDTDPKYLTYKISYLASACGFNSHSSFATIFKNIVGISPSDYLKSKQNAAL